MARTLETIYYLGYTVPMNLEDLLKHKKAILTLAKHHGAKNVRVFGSVVRGDSTEKSDVDILIDVEPETSLLDLGGLLMDLQDLLRCKVDIAIARSLKKRLKDRVLKEAVPL